MTITTKEEYERAKHGLVEKYSGFMALYSHFSNMPCAIYDSDSKGVNQQCLDDIWSNKKKIGCDKPSPYTAANQANKTYGQIVQDAYKLAKEKPGDCYTNSNKQFYGNIPSVSQINLMSAMKGRSFAKNDNPIRNMGSEDMCASNCTSQSNCISATYNSDSKKCWLNIGTYADWKPPVDGSANDVAFVNWSYKMLYELESLNNELHEYEVKNNISKPVIPSTGNLNKFLNDIPGKIYKFLSNKDLPTSTPGANSSGGANPTCTASTCAAAGDGSCNAPCGWNENNYCVCGGTGGKDPSGQAMSFDDIFKDDAVDPKEVDLLKKQFHDLNADRIATAKLLKGYKDTIGEMEAKQEDSNAALKKQMITIALIVVIGILLIFLLSAIIQSFNSGSNNSFSGGGLRTTMGSWKNMIFRKK